MHLTAADLGRIGMAVRPHALWELVLSLHVLQARVVPAPYVEWRRSVRGVLARHDALRDHVHRLTTLVPATGDFPDFLTPDLPGAGFVDMLTAVLGTPRARLARELSGAVATPWIRALADADPDALRALGDALTQYHRHCVEPYWDRIDNGVTADRELRVRLLLSGGSEQLLNGLPGAIRWDGDTLVSDYPENRSVVVGGRGLTLIPAYFCWHKPVSMVDATLPPVLVYPVDHPDDGSHRAAPVRLGALLGHTRARILYVLRTPCSTTEIARHVGISIGSASKQTAVLREAGLITSIRHERSVVHALTCLGQSIAGNGARP
jgi:DNA-binding transcriptional ArsR family regulator